jgi:tetratricopeptide (TPR) repeat protein
VVSSAAWVEVQSGEYRAAAEFYRRAVALDPSDPDDWNRLSMAEDELGNYDASADAVRRILTDWPHLTDALPAGHIQALIDHLDRNSEARLALMTTLFEANWKREEESASELWYDLAVTLVERGAPEHARTVISRIGWPRPLMRLQADRRFDDLVTSGPEYVATSLAQQIGRLAQLSADNPRNLYTHNEWLEALLQAGRNKDVIDTSGELIDRIAAAPAERPAFHDSDDENFTLAIRSDALLQAGRQDDAVVAMARASTLTEYGESNVSQKLRLAQLYNGMLRPDDAVDVVEKLSVTAERYSLTKRDTIRMQAALIKGKRQKAETLLERILETGDDTYSLRLGALLRAGRVDEAARIFIERLQDRYKRGDALLMAQKRFEPAPLVGDLDYRRNRDTMLKRNDVMAAIDAVGRVQHYDVW